MKRVIHSNAGEGLFGNNGRKGAAGGKDHETVAQKSETLFGRL